MSEPADYMIEMFGIGGDGNPDINHDPEIDEDTDDWTGAVPDSVYRAAAIEDAQRLLKDTDVF